MKTIKISKDIDNLPGGKADKKSFYDLIIHHGDESWPKEKLKSLEKSLTQELEKGIEVELEHTSDNAMAEEIAMDHLWEDAKYYSKLSTIHHEGSKWVVINKKTGE